MPLKKDSTQLLSSFPGRFSEARRVFLSPVVLSIRSPLPPLHSQAPPSKGSCPQSHTFTPFPRLGAWLGKGIHLDENLPLELVWRGKAISRNIDWFGQEHVPKDLLEILSHVPLLSNAAVVLNGQNDGETGRRRRAIKARTGSGWNQGPLSSVSDPGLCALQEQLTFTAICAALSTQCSHPSGVHRLDKDWQNPGLYPKPSLPQNFSGHNLPLAGRRDTLPSQHIPGLVLQLWRKQSFTLLQPWLHPLSALPAGVLLYSLRGDKGMLLDSDQDIRELDLGG